VVKLFYYIIESLISVYKLNIIIFVSHLYLASNLFLGNGSMIAEKTKDQL
jgi:hypothetical protein